MSLWSDCVAFTKDEEKKEEKFINIKLINETLRFFCFVLRKQELVQLIFTQQTCSILMNSFLYFPLQNGKKLVLEYK